MPPPCECPLAADACRLLSNASLLPPPPPLHGRRPPLAANVRPHPLSVSHSWNFTPAPGWTKEEAQILKLCLMKLGVGRWIQILETGLLPGACQEQGGGGGGGAWLEGL